MTMGESLNDLSGEIRRAQRGVITAIGRTQPQHMGSTLGAQTGPSVIQDKCAGPHREPGHLPGLCPSHRAHARTHRHHSPSRVSALRLARNG